MKIRGILIFGVSALVAAKALAVAAVAIATAAAPSATNAVRSGDTFGAGSTFVSPVLTRWASDYEARTNIKINYQPVGSGSGLQQIAAAAVDFAASDIPLTPDQLTKLGMRQFPLVIGGVVPVVNIAGVKLGLMRFTGPVLADIFLGKIRTWNDPAIQSLNPGIRLPAAQIAVVHRLEASGTTFNWVNYLSKVSPEWKQRVGEGATVEWPVGLAGKGNDGVAIFVNQTQNSIGYVEYAYALQNNLSYGLVQNKAGRFVKPEPASFRAAAASAEWDSATDFYQILTDAPGTEAYPITATAFILMARHPRDSGRAMAARAFFQWALENGQMQAGTLHYVPLPDNLVQQIEDSWTERPAGPNG